MICLQARYVRVPTLEGYRLPEGFRIISIRRLSDGWYEVKLEPEALRRLILRLGGGSSRSLPYPTIPDDRFGCQR